jgi:ribose transport system ATP-binding protein
MSLLEARTLSKRYGAVVALRSATLVVEPGEVHALLGANGAGKSTLVKMLTGIVRPDSGTISVSGREVQVASPFHAARLGMAPVFQDPALVPDLTVAQNLRLTRTDLRAVRRWLSEMDFSVDFGASAQDVPLPTLRMLDLARALTWEPQLLVLDEITAALPADLAERVFAIMRRWREQGRSVLFISHRLAEVTAMCDRATVLRDGVDVGVLVPSEGGEAQIVETMLGPEVAAVARAAEQTEATAPPVPKVSGEELGAALETRGLGVSGALEDVSFQLRPGEIVGIAALEGQGQDELFECLAGQRKASSGEILVGGKPLKARTPYDAIRAGVVLVPADRMTALLPQRSVRESLTTPLYNRPARWGVIDASDERSRVRRAVDRLSIDIRAQRQSRRLSGGNQQKLTIGRWLAAGFQVMLCYDPTRGIDIGTKRQIYTLLRELAEQGDTILLFTSELSEIPLVCDRVLVLWSGRITGELDARAADEATLLHAMHGLAPDREVPA